MYAWFNPGDIVRLGSLVQSGFWIHSGIHGLPALPRWINADDMFVFLVVAVDSGTFKDTMVFVTGQLTGWTEASAFVRVQ